MIKKDYHEISIIVKYAPTGEKVSEMLIPIKAGGDRPMLILNCILDGFRISSSPIYEFYAAIDGRWVYRGWKGESL